MAGLVEGVVGERAVTSYDSPPPVKWAKGRGTVLFGELVTMGGQPTGRALIYTHAFTSRGKRVGICLFGKTSGYDGVVVSSGYASENGWTCSAEPEVQRFLETRIADGPTDRQRIATEALKVAYSQGIAGDHNDERTFDGWRRGYTFGDAMDVCEWFANIFLDVRLIHPVDGHHRVLVGAPLWVRTPSLEAVCRYADCRLDELDARRAAKLEAPPADALMVGRAPTRQPRTRRFRHTRRRGER